MYTNDPFDFLVSPVFLFIMIGVFAIAWWGITYTDRKRHTTIKNELEQIRNEITNTVEKELSKIEHELTDKVEKSLQKLIDQGCKHQNKPE